MAESVAVTVCCHCKANDHTFHIPTSNLPLPAYPCHCTTCRHTSGVLFCSWVHIPQGPSNLEALTAYQSSATVTRLFCNKCGAQMFIRERHSDGSEGWLVATGALGKSEGIVDWKDHIFVADTGDGGLSPFIRTINGKELSKWTARPQSSVWAPPESPLTKSETGDHLPARCHCGGISYYITRPNEESKAPAQRTVAPHFPDLMIAYNKADPVNDKHVPWWLTSNETKFLAGTCACASCRKVSGFDVMTWSFIPRLNVKSYDDKTIEFGTGTMKSYPSSPGITREFCSKCGATVFWHCDERPEILDVAVGLLGAIGDSDSHIAGGARRENWLDWWKDRVSFKEYALNPTLIDALERGLEQSKST